ncbi:hypothetical protein J8273_2072 [Carpediemonas membranifera]|uniref:Uncharacterized protein n=1 Tax=Carpediemonas membranifera TaxID=201153 RepID=A0A8J6E426_9EUKA|nr:hypothetical protein J8273_2072 [Carpediemonas membranifera]|eukprot:KAG9396341.1 hypothetical protein J8273_2072 [Carpediemonas membranifera]
MLPKSTWNAEEYFKLRKKSSLPSHTIIESFQDRTEQRDDIHRSTVFGTQVQTHVPTSRPQYAQTSHVSQIPVAGLQFSAPSVPVQPLAVASPLSRAQLSAQATGSRPPPSSEQYSTMFSSTFGCTPSDGGDRPLTDVPFSPTNTLAMHDDEVTINVAPKAADVPYGRAKGAKKPAGSRLKVSALGKKG